MTIHIPYEIGEMVKNGGGRTRNQRYSPLCNEDWGSKQNSLTRRKFKICYDLREMRG